jgi:hypothetical protein
LLQAGQDLIDKLLSTSPFSSSYPLRKCSLLLPNGS